MNYLVFRFLEFYVNFLIDDSLNVLLMFFVLSEEISLIKNEKGRFYKWFRYLRSFLLFFLMEFCFVFLLMYRW